MEQERKNLNSPYGFRPLSPDEISGCLEKVKKAKFPPNIVDEMYACFYNMRDLSMVHSYNTMGDEFFKLCKKANIDLESFRKSETKREMTANYDATIMNQVFKLIEENEADSKKRVKGLKKNVLFKTISSLLPDIDKRHIQRSIKKHIKVGALVYEIQSKSSKLIRKGMYYNTYVRSYK